VKYRFIDAEKASFPVSMMCRLLEISRSGYYASKARPASKREQDDRRLRTLIRVVHREARGLYGRPRVHAALQRSGHRVGGKRVGRLMREEGLRGRTRRRFVVTTNSSHTQPIANNVLARDFSAPAPDRRWVGDITYLLTPNGFVFLAVVMDLYSRAIVGWALSEIIDRHLVIAALQEALQRRQPGPGLVAHSDRGCQYASDDYRSLLSRHGIICSMSRSGDCFDNAAMESWFSTLKGELGETFESMADARRQLFDYIEVFYNRQRLHSAIDYMTPAERERTTPPNGIAA